jgi:hypothetical protein
MLSLCLPPSPSVRPEYRGLFADAALDAASKAGRLELLKSINGQLREWKELLRRFLKSSDDQVGGWVARVARVARWHPARGCPPCFHCCSLPASRMGAAPGSLCGVVRIWRRAGVS